MASDLREKKYRFVFNRYWDCNYDGCVDIKDIDIQIKTACDLRGWEPGTPEFNRIRTLLYKIFIGMLDQLDTNKDGQITLDEWMALYDDFVKNPTKPREWIKLYETFVYELLNRNPKKDEVTKEDYLFVLTHYGMSKENAEKAFDIATNGRPTMTRAEFTKLWHEYFTSDDPNSAGNVLCGFEQPLSS